MRKFLLLTLLLIISSLLFAGPFGLDFGDSIEEAEAKGAEILESSRDASVMSCAVSPPKTLSNLTTYFGFFEDTYGLYMVRAFSNLMRSEIEIRNVYNTLKQQLIAAYGEPDEEIDTIDPDSIWDGTSDFAQSFYYGDRELGAYWALDEPKNGVWILALYVMPSDLSSAVYINLEYGGENYNDAWNSYTNSAASIL